MKQARSGWLGAADAAPNSGFRTIPLREKSSWRGWGYAFFFARNQRLKGQDVRKPRRLGKFPVLAYAVRRRWLWTGLRNLGSNPSDFWVTSPWWQRRVPASRSCLRGARESTRPAARLPLLVRARFLLLSGFRLGLGYPRKTWLGANGPRNFADTCLSNNVKGA